MSKEMNANKEKVSIAAVVVTYNRKELLRQNLNSLLAQTRPLDEIIVVNNASTDGTAEMLAKEFEHPQITVLTMPENIGGAGGFHEGMKLAYEKGHDWIWVMDDDAEPSRKALARLVEFAQQTPKSIPVSSARDNNLPRVLPVHNLAVAVDYAMFVGMLISREAVRLAGLPCADFFIYWDDIEYSWRLQRKGFTLYEVLDSKIAHKDWSRQPVSMRQVGPWILRRPKYADWKAYYLVRNQLLMHRYHKRYAGLLRAMVGVGKDCLAYTLLGELRKVQYILIGLVDGLLGRLGKRYAPSAK